MIPKYPLLLLSLLGASLLLPGSAAADHDHDDDDDDDERIETSHEAKRPVRLSLPAPETASQWKRYADECGSCHLAFPPSMLPARSWTAVLSNLGDHFGQNAEVDAPALRQLEAFLAQNAGRAVPGPTPLRITALPWWRRAHHELAPAVFRRKAVVSPANCIACHPGANVGAFDEHEVKIPRDAPSAR